MKKSLTLVSLFLSTNLFANTPAPQSTEVPQPKLVLQVMDFSRKVATALPENKLSRSNAKLQLCWTAFDMPFLPTNHVVQQISSPRGGKFVATVGSSISSKDGTTHTITSTMEDKGRGALSQCWQFDKTDPIGKYSIAVRINNTNFPAMPFEIVK